MLLGILSKLTRHMYFSFGAKDGSENARIVFPLWTYVDRLVITKPGEKPPELGQRIYEPPKSVKARKSSNNTGDWNLEDIYTVSFNSSNVDFPTWNVVNVPLAPDTDLHTFWGDSKMHIVVYDIPKDIGRTKHVNSKINYGIDFQVNDELLLCVNCVNLCIFSF